MWRGRRRGVCSTWPLLKLLENGGTAPGLRAWHAVDLFISAFNARSGGILYPAPEKKQLLHGMLLYSESLAAVAR